MRIVELTVFHVRIPLRKPIRHASFTRQETDNLIVRCVLEDRIEGYGEGVPREYVTGESIDSCMALLRANDWRSLASPCPSFEHAVQLLTGDVLVPVAGDERGCQANAARCAVELAILDAYGRHYGCSVSDVVRLLAPEIYEARSKVRYSGAITSARGFKLRLAAWSMRIYGFQQVKVKVGIAGYDDVERLRIIRGRLGRKVELRVDANAAWHPDEAVERIRSLEPFGISSVEQPIPHSQVHRLPQLRNAIHTPIMLDESLCSVQDAQAAIINGYCDLFNIRLSKCGGIIPSLRLVQLARQHGLGYQLGCQVGETAILSAAGRHFASSVAQLRSLEGSYDKHLVREPLGTKDISFGWGGWARALPGPGLGIVLDEQALKRVTIRKEPLFG